MYSAICSLKIVQVIDDEPTRHSNESEEQESYAD